jgi:hypothetical protein
MCVARSIMTTAGATHRCSEHNKLRTNPATATAWEVREQLPDFFTSRDEVLMRSTLLGHAL